MDTPDRPAQRPHYHVVPAVVPTAVPVVTAPTVPAATVPAVTVPVAVVTVVIVHADAPCAVRRVRSHVAAALPVHRRGASYNWPLFPGKPAKIARFSVRNAVKTWPVARVLKQAAAAAAER